MDQAERVLIIASQGWFDSYQHGPGNPGPGAACEASMIRQELYDKKYTNSKFRLVSFEEMDISLIPTDLRGYHAYRADMAKSRNLMIRWLGGESLSASQNQNRSYYNIKSNLRPVPERNPKSIS